MSKALKNLLCKVFSQIDGPVQDIIVFESNPEFQGNVNAVYQEMLKRGVDKKYKFIWLVRDKSIYKNIENDKLAYLEYKPSSIIDKLVRFYYLNRARAIIFENRIMFKSWKNQFVMNLTHGMPIKKLGGYKQYDTCDYLLSISDYLNSMMATEFGVPSEKIVSLGYPRNDALGQSTCALKKLGLDGFSTVVVWMPTFRQRRKSKDVDGGDYPGGIPLMDNLENIKILNETLKEENVCLIVKLHPEQEDKGLTYLNESNIKYLGDANLTSMGVKPYELLGESGALLTDYSSVYFDYLLTNRPIGLVIDDIEDYRRKKGFAFADFKKEIKGTYICTFEELKDFLVSVGCGENKDLEIIAKRKAEIYSYPDFNSTERVTDFILDKLK